MLLMTLGPPACGGSAERPDTGESSQASGTSGATSSSGDGVGSTGVSPDAGTDPGSCSVCETCPEDYVLLECNPNEVGGCACANREQVDKDAYETLSSCPAESPCAPASFWEDFEGLTPSSWTNRDCLFTALRDRTPGRYEFAQSRGDPVTTTTTRVLLITLEGDTVHSGFTSTGAVGSSSATLSYHSPERCTLGVSRFFDDCLQAGEGCSDFEQWFIDCSPAEAECPN